MEFSAEQYAFTLNINPHKEYSADEAAKLCRVGVNRIRQAKRDGELNYVAIGEKRYLFLGADLVRWKLSKRITVSGNTTSQKTDRESGAVLGMTNRPSKESQHLYALETLKKPSAH